ncbi:pyridoxamine 5'-phosphate oxidase [Nocardioides sp. TF02-7]|uniref:pyridoxamine 5'-phosphate oxidase n=1 Tax=Nocardioides sp. TF02-7 TaxID=2917724 RepID=UPI0031F526F5
MEEPDLAALRQEYGAAGLVEADADPDPWLMWRRWFADAQAAHLHEPNAMVVATVSPDGRPSARTVLLKGVSEEGFAFFTNTASRKGEALAHEPRCALLFPWHPLERQVRVEGVAAPLDADAVATYFASRPRHSQLGAWASPQSTVVPSREDLAERFAAAERRFAGREVPVPPEWGGYRVRPETFEFWQGRPGRMQTGSATAGTAAEPGWSSGWRRSASAGRRVHLQLRELQPEQAAARLVRRCRAEPCGAHAQVAARALDVVPGPGGAVGDLPGEGAHRRPGLAVVGELDLEHLREARTAVAGRLARGGGTGPQPDLPDLLDGAEVDLHPLLRVARAPRRVAGVAA